VFKNNFIKPISEDFTVQFRAEFFNFLNRANFAVPVTPDNVTIFDSTGVPVPGAGLLTSTTAREIQSALKLVWVIEGDDHHDDRESHVRQMRL
jgi:hypothetical protein